MKNYVTPIVVIVVGFAVLFSCKHLNSSRTELAITSLSATHAGGDSSLTIIGTGFSVVNAEILVKVNGKRAVVTKASPTSISIKIPKEAGDGDISVTVNQKTFIKKGFVYDWVAIVSTIAGNPTNEPGFNDGIGTSASFYRPWGICIDTNTGDLYVADFYNSAIRKVSLNGEVITLAASIATSFPTGICKDTGGNLYITSQGRNSIYKISPLEANTFRFIAGNFDDGWEGSANGNGRNASFNMPDGICMDIAGNLYIADNGNHLIRKIKPNGDVSTIAGNSARGKGNSDGKGSSAQFNSPNDLCMDASGNLYITDGDNNSIRKITPQGEVSTFAGSVNRDQGFVDGVGTNARFNGPEGISIDRANNLYVADSYNSCIRKITLQKVVTTIAGNAIPGESDGIGASAQFRNPWRIAIDKNGDLYITDNETNSIRKIMFQ